MPNEENEPKKRGGFKKGFNINRYSSPKGKEPPNFQKVQEARKEMKNKTVNLRTFVFLPATLKDWTA